MAKIVGVHKLALKPGVNGLEFEVFMQQMVLANLGTVSVLDKRISHDFLLATWADSEHLLLRSTEEDKEGNYSWLISADLKEPERLDTEEGRRAAHQEAQGVAEEFFSLGNATLLSAAAKIEPFATRTAFASYLEVGSRRSGAH